ncbi:MAG: COG1361 S-layer family protein [Candidatus Woesearchaeota archaeon]
MKKALVLCFFIAICALAAYAEVGSSAIIGISVVNQDPDPATAGNVVEIRLGVENTGSAIAENLVMEILPEYPFTIVPGASPILAVGTINAYQQASDMKILKFRLMVDRDATAGEYELKLKQSEEGKVGISVIRTVNIDVKSKESAEIIYIDKTLLVPGMEDTLKFTINNVGNAPLRDLTFSWVNDDKIILPVGGDNTKYVRYIDVGDSAELEYKVIADTNVDAGLYELQLKLAYDDPLSITDKEINTIAGIYVGGGTDFEVAFSETSSGQTSFTIANIGSNPAFSVSVVIPQQQAWRATGSNSMIIGNLNTGDYTVASFGLQNMQARQQNRTQGTLPQSAGQNTESQNTIKVQVAYTNTMGKREVVEKEVYINPQTLAASVTTAVQTATVPYGRMQQQSFFSKYKWYIVVLFVLLIVGAGYYRYHKKKLVDHNFKFRDLFGRTRKK